MPFLRPVSWLTAAVLLVVAVLALGISLPKWIIDPGLHRYAGGKRAFAEGALSMIESTDFRDSTDAYIAMAHRVVGVERCAPPSARAFRVEVRLYTVFGIPYGEKKTACMAPLFKNGGRSTPSTEGFA